MAEIPFRLPVLRLPDPDSQSRGGVVPTPLAPPPPPACSLRPRPQIGQGCGSHPPTGLAAPSAHSDWCACLPRACSDWPVPVQRPALSLPAPRARGDWLLSDAHSDWPKFARLPLASPGLAAFKASEPIGWLRPHSLPNPLPLRAFA